MKNGRGETQPGFSGISAVELCNISKTYPGKEKKANSNISLGLRRGEILCIAGENGAGKTTLMKILCGLETPDAGEIRVNGSAVTIDSPLAARKLGIGMAHQHFMLFPEYTVAENIVMGVEPRKWGIFSDRAGAEAAAAAVIDAHHFSITPDKPVHTLSMGEMQQVEICRLLYRNADIIILDEPASVLTEREVAALFTALRTLAQAGKSLFLITHKPREIKLVSDRVAVLRRGELVGVHETKEIDEYAVSKLMMCDAATYKGNMLAANPAHSSVSSCLCEKYSINNSVIEFNNVTVLRRGQQRPLLDRVSFAARSGEILGFTGVGGNGLGVLEAVLGGFLHPAEGTITHNGRDISRLNIRRLRNQGLAFVPADRLRVGSAPDAAVDENMIIDRRREFSRYGFLDRGAIRIFCEGLISRYTIRGTGGAKSVSALSGGNLQKLILAREIDRFRDYFVFSEPSRGLDIAAADFIRCEIAALREKGAAIILISGDLDEILALADRIIVMYRGTAAAEFDNNVSINKEIIGNYMQGLA